MSKNDDLRSKSAEELNKELLELRRAQFVGFHGLPQHAVDKSGFDRQLGRGERECFARQRFVHRLTA